MHGSSSGSGPGKKARIEIIPLIDVIFFLLATFVLFTISLNKSDGLRVPLPAVKTALSRDTDKTVTVTVTDTDEIHWNTSANPGVEGQRPMTLDEFIKQLTQFRQKEPMGKILINGHENAKWAVATYVLDESRKAGFDKIYIETRSKPDTK